MLRSISLPVSRCATFLYCGASVHTVVVTAVRVVVVDVHPRVAAFDILTVIVVVVVIDGPPRFGRDARASAVLTTKWKLRTMSQLTLRRIIHAI